MKRQRLLRKPLRATEAFSLIEVVLALSIVAIGLITIMGLFPQALTSGKNAVDDSICGMIAEDTIAARKIDIQTGKSTIGAPNIPPRWFTANGTEIFVPPDLPSNATFQVVITAAPVPGLPNNVNVESTQIQIFWPWLTPNLTKAIPPPSTNTFYTEITKF